MVCYNPQKFAVSISRLHIYLHALAEISYIYIKSVIKCNIRYNLLNTVSHPLTPSLAWLSISRRIPDESYKGVAASEGGLGAAEEDN